MTTQKSTKTEVSLKGVLVKLEKLNLQLSAIGLGSFLPFNNAYIIITQHFQTAMSVGEFSSLQVLKQLDITFANYYFQAIEQAKTHTKLQSPWQQVADCSGRVPGSLALILGANAHINHDLPLALYDCRKNLSHFKSEFFAADKVFLEAKPDIVAYIKNMTNDYKYTNDKINSMVIRIIIHWRHQAWKKYEALCNNKLKPADLLISSIKTGNRIAKLGHRPLRKY